MIFPVQGPNLTCWDNTKLLMMQRSSHQELPVD
jgi:hypothetical protein